MISEFMKNPERESDAEETFYKKHGYYAQ